MSELGELLKLVDFCVNLFGKAIELLRCDDHKIYIEYGAFVYQMHSYCSRQLKIVSIYILCQSH